MKEDEQVHAEKERVEILKKEAVAPAQNKPEQNLISIFIVRKKSAGF